MAKKTAPLLPATTHLLTELGARLKLARLRRKLTAKQLAERAGMSPMTLRSLEAGGAGVTIGAYMSVMQVLGIERDIARIADVDEVGRQLQDARLVVAKSPRAPKGNTYLVAEAIAPPRLRETNIEESFSKAVTTDSLAALLISPKGKQSSEQGDS
ncbi:helix-turn-helix domain-containing protein [Pseudomonas sp. R5(2019)]|uniref:helix-turn-helix domain-containing protein n=1 Tax=Pseudomonas sp. R5(2019) TaxID=2697566 RepID=UPI0014120950|nr:helix-turn-helix transcriptional regulator [Pseudomonas sp. R5(2019)]NBA97935.1 helix-turn-helix domain-containing protein [Pseudomonas sp. R5(2019)]